MLSASLQACHHVRLSSYRTSLQVQELGVNPLPGVLEVPAAALEASEAAGHMFCDSEFRGCGILG